jgi:hypothetical protein
MKNRLINLFVYTAGGLLFVTAMAKLVSAGGSAKALSLQDPLLYLSNRQVLIGVAVVELVVAGFALFGKNLFLRVSLISWLATNFLIYRIGLAWIGHAKPCGCLGTITDSLSLSPHTVNTIAKLILIFLLVCGYASLIKMATLKRSNGSARSQIADSAGSERA